MKWIKDNWLAVGIALGIVVSLFIIQRDQNQRTRDEATKAAQRSQQQQKATIEGCTRTSTFKSLDANFALRAAAARRADGNKPAGDYYEAIGDGIILTIPAPPGMQGNREIVEVELKVIKGEDRYVVTPRASSLQREGCRLAYAS